MLKNHRTLTGLSNFLLRRKHIVRNLARWQIQKIRWWWVCAYPATSQGKQTPAYMVSLATSMVFVQSLTGLWLTSSHYYSNKFIIGPIPIFALIYYSRGNTIQQYICFDMTKTKSRFSYTGLYLVKITLRFIWQLGRWNKWKIELNTGPQLLIVKSMNVSVFKWNKYESNFPG